MEKQDLRIIYMGTPDFAVESLKRLVEGGYNVVAVITMPDKPAGRGHKIQYSPVKEYRTTPLPSKHNYAPGSIHTDGKNHIDIACTDGFIRIEELQLAGKKRMAAPDLLRGFHLNDEFRCE